METQIQLFLENMYAVGRGFLVSDEEIPESLLIPTEENRELIFAAWDATNN